MTRPSFRIAVVGGGTAGWLAALILREGGRRAGLKLDVSVIESSKVPTIGVGEGTTAVFREMLRHLNLVEGNSCAKPGPRSSTESGTGTGVGRATAMTGRSMTPTRSPAAPQATGLTATALLRDGP